ncbi:MAG: DUF2306 domain-containing protein [Planctomycetota bacterium]|nr:DUF2306 domain-containing protein [Planctomycetota bacterium]
MVQTRITPWFFWCLAVLVLLTVAYAAIVLKVGVPSALRPSFDDQPWWFRIHIGCGVIALLFGLLQFHAGFRRRWTLWHRRLGLVYLVMVIASGVAGFILSFSSATGVISDWGFRLLSIFWIATTVIAYWRIMNRDIAHHREWMVRSYALTLAAVTLRLELTVGLMVTNGAFDVVYPIIAYACWIPNLLVAEVWIRWTRIKPVASR